MTPVAATLLRFLLAQRRRFLPGVALAILRCLVIAPGPLLFQLIIDEYVATGQVGGIVVSGVIFLGLLLLHYAFSVRGAEVIAEEMARVVGSLRSDIAAKLNSLEFGYLDRARSGGLLAKYAFDTQKVEGAIWQCLNQFVPNVLYSIATTILLLLVNWQLSLTLLVIVPVLVGLRQLFYGHLREANETNRLAQEALASAGAEVIAALRVVRSLGAESEISKYLNSRNAEYGRTKTELSRRNSVFSTFSYVAMQFLTLVVIGGGALFVIRGAMTVGSLLAFMAALPVILMPMNLFAAMSEQYFVGEESYRSIRELLESDHVERWQGRAVLTRFRGELRLEAVSYSYPNSCREVLSGASISIGAGEHVALVGPSGAGKSTVAYLLLGLCTPTEGSVLVDGVKLSDIDIRWYRRQCSVVLQDGFLLSGSVADNIRLSRPDATDEEVRAAARTANADEFIRQLPDAYNAIVGERGALLSAGQRQRLTIARAVLRDPRILILDEATSSLDYESEREVQSALERVCRNRTVVTIAHRMQTIMTADRVIALENGHAMEKPKEEVLCWLSRFTKGQLVVPGIVA